MLETNNQIVNSQPHTVIVGGGPVGVRLVSELLKFDSSSRITLFSDDPHRPYNRVCLSQLLAGDMQYQDLELRLPSIEEAPNFKLVRGVVTGLSHRDKRVYFNDDQGIDYDRLVLATGARAHIPSIEGLDQTGVFTFRSLRDAEALYARISSAKHVVVVGGGLLGVETAKALLKNNTQVTLVQQGEHLLNQQLDSNAAGLLSEQLASLSIAVLTNQRVSKVTGHQGRVSGVLLRDKQLISCDTVVFCTGITPNIELAREARITVNRAVVVDQNLQTSAESVFAIGECSEYSGQTLGLANPGYEQAAILADRFSGGQATYSGSIHASRLKVLGYPVISLGQVVNYRRSPLHREVVFQSDTAYRKLVFERGRLQGVMAVGKWSQLERAQEACLRASKIPFWRRWVFARSGRLWWQDQSQGVQNWSAEALICQCNRVAKSEIDSSIQQIALAQGSVKLECVMRDTGAGTVCGSCKPLLQQLLGGEQKAEKEWAWMPILAISFLVIAVATMIALVPGIAPATSVQEPQPFEFLWTDKFYKQVSGFSLLGLSVVGLLMSLRKRFKRFALGQFSHWRFFHIALGLCCSLVLLAHTGLHLGDNLNRLLLINFLLVLVMGGLASLALSVSHTFQPTNAQTIRKLMSWGHLLISWPLPVLLAVHIFTVYYF